MLKGKLKNTSQGWVVEYLEFFRTVKSLEGIPYDVEYLVKTLPVIIEEFNPEVKRKQSIIPLIEGKEVEFVIEETCCNKCSDDSDCVNKGVKYEAKLIREYNNGLYKAFDDFFDAYGAAMSESFKAEAAGEIFGVEERVKYTIDILSKTYNTPTKK